MKAIAISILLISGMQLSIFSQNRICEWDTEKISSVSIKFSYKNEEKVKSSFNKTFEINEILNFFKKVEFRPVDSSNRDLLMLSGDEEYKISFSGQRDQVYLQSNTASIGKTSFLIDPSVIKDFSALIQELKKR